MTFQRIAAIAFLAAICAWAPARADSTDDIYIEKARQFVRDNPLEKTVDQTPRQALAFWRRIDGLENMMTLLRLGVLPENLQSQLKWRLNRHSELRTISFHNGDPDVAAVASLVNLHAKVALAHLRGNADKYVYGDVTLAVSNIGRPLFRKLAPEYAPEEYRKDDEAAAARSKAWNSK